MSDLACKKCGEAGESRLKEGVTFSDGSSMLVLKAKLKSGPWLCDLCTVNTELNKGDYAYLFTYMPKRETEDFASAIYEAKTWDVTLHERYDLSYETQYFRLRDFRLNSRNEIVIYGPEWPDGYSCNILMHEI